MQSSIHLDNTAMERTLKRFDIVGHVVISGWVRVVRYISCMAVIVVLTACAGSVAPPAPVTDMSQDQKAALRVTDITGEAGPGVAMTPADISRIIQQVTAEIRATSPTVLVPADDPQAANARLMKITFTRYDEGNAFARFMLAGLGQIYIEGDVAILDRQTMRVMAEYKVSKDFSFGGIYGGTTKIQDVEKGFARSVAAVVQPKT